MFTHGFPWLPARGPANIVQRPDPRPVIPILDEVAVGLEPPIAPVEVDRELSTVLEYRALLGAEAHAQVVYRGELEGFVGAVNLTVPVPRSDPDLPEFATWGRQVVCDSNLAGEVGRAVAQVHVRLQLYTTA